MLTAEDTPQRICWFFIDADNVSPSGAMSLVPDLLMRMQLVIQGAVIAGLSLPALEAWSRAIRRQRQSTRISQHWVRPGKDCADVALIMEMGICLKMLSPRPVVLVLSADRLIQRAGSLLAEKGFAVYAVHNEHLRSGRLTPDLDGCRLTGETPTREESASFPRRRRRAKPKPIQKNSTKPVAQMKPRMKPRGKPC